MSSRLRCGTCRGNGYVEVEVNGHETDRLCPVCLDGDTPDPHDY